MTIQVAPLFSLILASAFFGCSQPQTTGSQGPTSPKNTSATQQSVDSAGTDCPLTEVPIGVIDVDFDGGLSNISGPVTVMVCGEGRDTLSPSDIQSIRAEFESIVRELWLPMAFSCSANPPFPPESREQFVTLHNNALQRINSALRGPSIQDFICHLGFSEVL